jgi:hypothetical protein
MLSVDPAEVVRLISWVATQRNERLTAIRLVKFLFLADLYHARRNSGQTLTGWSWKFVHYGPFCGESLDAIKSAAEGGLIETFAYESKYTGEEREVYACADRDREPSLMNRLPSYVTIPLAQAVRRWADDTAGLLDHVYFATEPMIDARPGAVLDFSTSRELVREQPVQMLKLSEKKLRRAREALQRMKASAVGPSGAVAEADLYDEVYEQGMRAIDGEPLKAGLVGEAQIIPRVNVEDE